MPSSLEIARIYRFSLKLASILIGRGASFVTTIRHHSRLMCNNILKKSIPTHIIKTCTRSSYQRHRPWLRATNTHTHACTHARTHARQRINKASEQRRDSIKTVPGCGASGMSSYVLHPLDIMRNPDQVHRHRCCDQQSRRVTSKLIAYSVRRHVYVYYVATRESKNTLLEQRFTRRDAWADHVRTRLLAVHDLSAADAVYDQSCSVDFRTRKVVPQMLVRDEDVQKKVKVGRPNKSTNAGRPVSDV